MKIDTVERDGTTSMRLDGRLDAHSSAKFETEMNQLIADGARLVDIDFSKIDFVTSSGLRVLLAAARRLKGLGGTLTVSGLNKTVEEIFDVAGFASLLKLWSKQ